MRRSIILVYQQYSGKTRSNGRADWQLLNERGSLRPDVLLATIFNLEEASPQRSPFVLIPQWLKDGGKRIHRNGTYATWACMPLVQIDFVVSCPGCFEKSLRFWVKFDKPTLVVCRWARKSVTIRSNLNARARLAVNLTKTGRYKKGFRPPSPGRRNTVLELEPEKLPKN